MPPPTEAEALGRSGRSFRRRALESQVRGTRETRTKSGETPAALSWWFKLLQPGQRMPSSDGDPSLDSSDIRSKSQKAEQAKHAGQFEVEQSKRGSGDESKSDLHRILSATRQIYKTAALSWRQSNLSETNQPGGVSTFSSSDNYENYIPTHACYPQYFFDLLQKNYDLCTFFLEMLANAQQLEQQKFLSLTRLYHAAKEVMSRSERTSGETASENASDQKSASENKSAAEIESAAEHKSAAKKEMEIELAILHTGISSVRLRHNRLWLLHELHSSRKVALQTEHAVHPDFAPNFLPEVPEDVREPSLRKRELLAASRLQDFVRDHSTNNS